MKEVFLGPTLVFAFRIIGAWPGHRSVCIRILIWLLMAGTIVGQFLYALDYKQHEMDAVMEVVATNVTNVLSLQKIFFLWRNRGYIEQCLDTMAEDWKNITNSEHLALMSRHANIARCFRIWVMGSYYLALFSFATLTMVRYFLESSDYTGRALMVKAKYPFDPQPSPIYEIFIGIGMIQGVWLVGGNVMADSLLIAMIAHVSGQFIILQDRILHLSDTKEFPGIVQEHQRIIRFAENVAETFKWIGLAEFISGSVIICALGFELVTSLETDPGVTVMRFGTYILAMTFGVFIYCCAGNILSEESLNIRDAVYASRWVDLPPHASKILMMIMTRADKPLCITAGNFFAMDYGSFISIMKTAASYLSVIQARSEQL